MKTKFKSKLTRSVNFKKLEPNRNEVQILYITPKKYNPKRKIDSLRASREKVIFDIKIYLINTKVRMGRDKENIHITLSYESITRRRCRPVNR